MESKARILQIVKAFVDYKYARLFLGISLFLLLPAILPQEIALLVLYSLPIYLAIKRYGIIHEKKLLEQIKSVFIQKYKKKDEKNVLYSYYLLISFMPLTIYVINLFKIQQNINKLLVIPSFISIVLLSEFIIVFVIKIIKNEEVSDEIIIGSISMYLLCGILWFFMYLIIFLLDPCAFLVTNGEKIIKQPLDLLYFSFKTLTTVGYGDIVPMSFIAKIITNFEGIIGVMFPAVFIARLVGSLKSR